MRVRRGARGPRAANRPARCSHPRAGDVPRASGTDGERPREGLGCARRSKSIARMAKDGQRHCARRGKLRRRIGDVEQGVAERILRAEDPMHGLRAAGAHLDGCRRGAGEAQSAAWATGLGHHGPFRVDARAIQSSRPVHAAPGTRRRASASQSCDAASRPPTRRGPTPRCSRRALRRRGHAPVRAP